MSPPQVQAAIRTCPFFDAVALYSLRAQHAGDGYGDGDGDGGPSPLPSLPGLGANYTLESVHPEPSTLNPKP